MAWEAATRSIPAVAAVDLTALQYQFAIFDSAGKITSGGTNLTAQGRVDGIIGEGVAVDVATNLVVPDGAIVMIKLGATLVAGAEIGTAADGRAVALGAANGNLSWGILLEGGDADEIVSMQFKFNGQVNA